MLSEVNCLSEGLSEVVLPLTSVQSPSSSESRQLGRSLSEGLSEVPALSELSPLTDESTMAAGIPQSKVGASEASSLSEAPVSEAPPSPEFPPYFVGGGELRRRRSARISREAHFGGPYLPSPNGLERTAP